jgi:hypothetical protein
MTLEIYVDVFLWLLCKFKIIHSLDSIHQYYSHNFLVALVQACTRTHPTKLTSLHSSL